ncbi:MAG: hypothetical protein KJ041_10960, partial [Gammaproteobacteria bacterium]|nr:hypothetical protein [Gammaproteobacteria bacterium]
GGLRIPRLAWIALLFMLWAVLVTVVGEGPLIEKIAGFKRYFQMWGVLLFLALLPPPPRSEDRLWRFLFLLGFVELVFVLHQVIVLVPIREAMGNLVAVDVVAGTFGARLEGGGSNNTLSAFMAVFLAGVLGLRAIGHLPGWRYPVALVAALLPFFLGETKSAFLYLTLAMLVMARSQIARRPLTTLLQMVLGLFVLVALMQAYVTLYSKGKSAEEWLENILAYNIGDVGYGALAELNRTTTYSYWFEQHVPDDPAGLLLGHGLGAAFLDYSEENPGHAEARYSGMGIGLTGLSSLLWDVGLPGTLLFLSIPALAIRRATRLWAASRDPVQRLRLKLSGITVLVTGTSLLLAPSMTQEQAVQCLFALAVGYIASAGQRRVGAA